MLFSDEFSKSFLFLCLSAVKAELLKHKQTDNQKDTPTHTPPSTQLKPSHHKHSLYNQPQPTEVSFYPPESQLRPPPGFPQRGSGHPRGADQGGDRLPPRPRGKLNAFWDSPIQSPCGRPASANTPSSAPWTRARALVPPAAEPATERQRDRRTDSLGARPPATLGRQPDLLNKFLQRWLSRLQHWHGENFRGLGEETGQSFPSFLPRHLPPRLGVGGADLIGTRRWGDRSPEINKRPNKEHDAPRNWHRSGALPCFQFPPPLHPHPHLPWHGLGRAAGGWGGRPR